jgi:SAM-dependent methyltransferase
MDWEERYESGDTPWEKGAPAPPLLEWLESRGSIHGDVLVPGCGSGHDVRAISAASPDAKVIGLDIAQSAIDRDGQFSLVGNETYQRADLFDLPAGLINRFDWVFEHTCFCALEPARRVDYVRAITRALKPEGALLAIFFLNPWDPGEMPAGGGPPFAVTHEELDLLFATHFELVEELKPRRAYPEREGREIIRLLRRNARARKESAHGFSD